MTALRSSDTIEPRPAGSRVVPLLLALLVAAIGTGCASSKTPAWTDDDVLLPLTHPTRWGPEPSDFAAARLAEAALANQPENVEAALGDLEEADDSHSTKGLPALGADLANSTLDDEFAYRDASKQVLKRPDVDYALQARLKQTIADDRLKLAGKRRRDTWEVLYARTFNAMSEPLGRALMTGLVTAPFTIAQTSAHYLASFSNDEPLSITHRQALVLHREHIARYPEAENADKIRGQITTAERKYVKTMQRRRVRVARRFLRSGKHRAAVAQAEQALEFGENESADEIIEKAEAAIAVHSSERAMSTEVRMKDASGIDDPDAARLATALLAATGRPLRVSELRKLGIDPDGPLGNELDFAEALAQIESGYVDEGTEHLREIMRERSEDNPMVRHATTLAARGREDPYDAFKRTERAQFWALVRFRIFDRWTRGTSYPNLPKPIAYLVEGPSIAQTVATTPVRLILGNWNTHPDYDRTTAVAAYRYLALESDGEHKREVLQWLVDYEEGRGNSVAALRLADFMPDLHEDRRFELLEKASEQALTGATQIRRADEQNQFLRKVAREFPETEAGHEAGVLAREQLRQHTVQHIRITKSFLLENPRVAGEEGIGLRPELLNDRMEDGELHPSGVAFLGGRKIEIALVAASGDEDERPVAVYKNVSTRRLGRTAALLDRTARKNELIDPDQVLGNDGDRDNFIERASLGLTEDVDDRASARSTYVYRSMRERYGMVRGRDSILPVDLVFQGSFTDLSLAAFPRWRKPKLTQDSFLYR